MHIRLDFCAAIQHSLFGLQADYTCQAGTGLVLTQHYKLFRQLGAFTHHQQIKVKSKGDSTLEKHRLII